MTATKRRTLVVHYHPSSDSLINEATSRVLAGLATTSDDVQVLDLVDFDPALSGAEWRGDCEPSSQIAHHIELLRWATRIVLVYPTWWGGQPAVIKGWFDRVWVCGVAYEPVVGKNRIRGLLKNVRSLEIVTSHGSPRSVSVIQGSPGKVTAFRTMRLMCHWACRPRWTAIYDLANKSQAHIDDWLDHVEARYR